MPDRRKTKAPPRKGGRSSRKSAGRARSKPRRPRPAASRRVKSGQRVREVERAIKTLGEGKVKAGNVRVSQSNFVTIGRRGTGAKSVARVLRAIRGAPVSPFFTYKVTVRYRKRDGKMGTKTFPGLGVPRPESLRRRRRKGERIGSTLNRFVMREITRTVQGVIRKEWGKYKLGDTTTKMGRKKARARLRNIKRQQEARFKVEFFRETQGAGRAGRTRQRRR